MLLGRMWTSSVITGNHTETLPLKSSEYKYQVLHFWACISINEIQMFVTTMNESGEYCANGNKLGIED